AVLVSCEPSPTTLDSCFGVEIPKPVYTADPLLQLQLARRLRHLDRLCSTYGRASPVAEGAPAFGTALGDLGALYVASRNLDSAKEALNLASELDPDELRWSHLLGHTLRTQGKFDDAREAFARVADSSPSVHPSHLYLAELDLELGATEAARERLARLYAAGWVSASVCFAQGRALEHDNQFSAAAAKYREALKLEPQASVISAALSAVLGRMGLRQEASHHAKRAGTVKPTPEDPWLQGLEKLTVPGSIRSGERALKTDRPSDARRHLSRVVAVAPENVRALKALGNAERRLGNTEAAIAHLREAARLAPDDASTAYNLGTLHLVQSDLPEAKKNLVRATQLRPSHARAWFNLATVAEREGDEAAFVSHLTTSIEADPSFARAAQRLLRFYANTGRCNEAPEHIIKRRRDDPALDNPCDSVNKERTP
ncbi:MAG: tetratricopeptide repeat protein, partial [Myxococcota bacterium]